MNYCEYFSDTLKDLMSERQITIKILSEQTKIRLSRLYEFINEKRLPSLENAIKIAEYFHCSLDYLFGFSNNYENCKFETVSSIAERIRTVIDNCGKSRYAICKQLKIDQSQMLKWYKGKQIPALSSLLKIADLFDYSLDYLTGREKL